MGFIDEVRVVLRRWPVSPTCSNPAIFERRIDTLRLMEEVGEPARVRITFRDAPSGVEATEVLRLLSALTYEYDVVALLQGVKSADSRFERGTDDLPDFRPRWSPRLQEGDVRLRIAGVTYGSPLSIEVLGDPSVLADWLKVVIPAAGGSLLAAERLATMPSRVRARIANNRANELEAQIRAEAARSRIRRERARFGSPDAEVVDD